MANPNYSDIVTTTIENRSRKLADNLSANNALLTRLRRKGNVRPVSGGYTIMQEIMYDDPATRNAGSYSGFDVIDITPNSPITSAAFDLKQYAAAVTISGLEMLQNAGKEQMIDLLAARVEIAEKQLVDEIATDIYGDGTGNGGKAITGLSVAVSSAPNTGSYGGIDRATWEFWRNKVYRAVTDGGEAVDPTNIQHYMNTLAIKLIRGRDKPDLIVADNEMYTAYLESMQAIQRVSASDDVVGAGFASLKYSGPGLNADVVLDGGIGGNMPEDTMYFLNTDYLFLRPHTSRNFAPFGGDRQSVNQDAVVKLIGWAGNLTSSGPQFQGILTND